MLTLLVVLIGGLSIEELNTNIKQAQITSNNGNIFNGESPESITLTANLQGKGTNPLTYVWKERWGTYFRRDFKFFSCV